MRWPFGRRKQEVEIPPPPPTDTDPEAARRMAEVAAQRARVGARLTRRTRSAITANHFGATLEEAFRS